MNKLILLTILLSFSQSIYTQENGEKSSIIQGTKELPLELNLILESLQWAEQKDEEANKIPYLSENIIETLKHIDSYARVLSKEDIFLIGKIEIYKTLLKTNNTYPKAVIDGNSLKTLNFAIKNSTDPFVKWFLQALRQDCDALLGTSVFKEYLLQKNTGQLDRLESRRIDKKVQLIYRWVSLINPDASNFQEAFRLELVPAMIEALKNIEQSFYLMTHISNFQTTPDPIKSVNEMKFFVLKEAKKKTSPLIKKEKSVDEILAPITDEGSALPPVLPEPSKDDWGNDANTPTNLKNLPKPSDDASWLQDF